jgi:hypothetical protein
MIIIDRVEIGARNSVSEFRAFIALPLYAAKASTNTQRAALPTLFECPLTFIGAWPSPGQVEIDRSLKLRRRCRLGKQTI